MARFKRINLYRRGFLNHARYQSIALYLAEASTRLETKYRSQDEYVELDAALTLGDCNRQITLDFNTDSTRESGEIGNVQHKNDLLRKIVNEFCDAVDEGLNQVRDKKWSGEDAE